MSFQEETIEKLIKLIEGSPQLGKEDKEALGKNIKNLPFDYVLFLIDLFENSPEEIALLSQNIKEKEEILKNRNGEAWQKLLKKEKDTLEKLAE